MKFKELAIFRQRLEAWLKKYEGLPNQFKKCSEMFDKIRAKRYGTWVD